MKKFSKILLVILSVLALVAVMAFAISAADESVEGQFAVRDADGTLKGYATWAEAIAAAKTAGNYTIIVNEDWTISETADATPQGYSALYTTGTEAGTYKHIGWAEATTGTNFYTFQDGNDWTLDLNGKTVNVNMDGILFYLYNTKLTITGGGTLNNVRQIARVHKAAVFTIDATSPININPVAHATDADGNVTQQGRWVMFNPINNDTTLNFRGKININPADAGMLYINALNAKEVNFDSAVITIAQPKSDTHTKSLSEFLRADDKGITNLNFKNGTRIELQYGLMFKFAKADDNNTKVNLTGWLNHFPTKKETATVETMPEAMKNDIAGVVERYKTDACIFRASDTEFICDPCVAMDASATNQIQGEFMYIVECRLDAEFVNCDIYAGSRAFWGNSAAVPGANDAANSALTEGDYSYAAGVNQLRFKDTNFTRIAGGKDNNLFTYCVNAIWDGGVISNLSGNTASCTYFYDQPDPSVDFFYGAKFSNIKLVGQGSFAPTAAPADVTATGITNGWKAHFSVDGNIYKNYACVVDGVLTSYSYAVADTPSLSYGYVATGDGITVDYDSATDGWGTTSGSAASTKYDFISVLRWSGTPNGTLKEATLENGNNIVKIEFGVAGSNYYEFKPGSTNPGMATKYAIVEFDIATKTDTWGNAGFGFSPQNRFKLSQYTAGGTSLGLGSTAYTNGTGLTIGADGKTTLGGFKLPAGGVFSRITFIEEWRVVESSDAHAFQAYTALNTADGSNTVTLPGVNVTIYHHFFVNGDYAGTTNKTVGWMPVDQYTYNNSSLYQDGWRMTWNGAAGDGVYFDNLRYIGVPHDSSLDLTDYFQTGKNINGVALGTTGAYFNELPSANDYGKAPASVGSVNGVSYDNEADLVAAFDASKGYTKLELKADIDAKLNITGKSVLLKDNGHTYKLISADKKFADYTASLGGLLTVDAAASEIATIDFEYDEYGLKQVNAVLGTYFEIPSVYDPESADFAVESIEKGDGETTVTYDNLVGWTLGDSEELIATKGVTKATPVIKSEEAVWVYWNIYGVDKPTEDDLIAYYYNPALNLKGIPANDIEIYDGKGAGDWTKDASGWYETMAEFDQEFIETVDLSIPGKEYNVPLSTAKRAWVEMYANATLRTHFRFNYYLPQSTMEAAGIESVAVTKGGSALAAYGTDTIGSDEKARTWNVYSLLVGATNTTDFEVTVTYQVKGEDAPFTYTVNYGMPSYTNAVMTGADYSESAKSLVMNIVNYADNMLAVGGKAANATYTKLLETYGEKYLPELADSEFKAGGAIYDAEVADLNKDTEGAKYFDSVSITYTEYEPVFTLKYSDFAKSASTTYGIQKPNNNAGSQAWGHSSKGVTTQIKAGNSSTFPLHHLAAEKGSTTFIKDNTSAAWTVSEQGNYDYYVYALTTYETSTAGWAFSGLPTFSDYADVINFAIYVDGVNVEGTDDPATAIYEYSLAAYVSSLIEAKADADEIELAKAMYSLAKAAYDYKGGY